MVNYNKPLGITLLTFFLLLLAFVILSLFVYVFFYGGDFWYDGLLKDLRYEEQKFLAIITFSILILISGIGLLKSRSLGRWILIALCGIGAIHGAFIAQIDLNRGVLILGMCIVIALYMLTPSVSESFKPMASTKAVDAIDTLESYRKSRF